MKIYHAIIHEKRFEKGITIFGKIVEPSRDHSTVELIELAELQKFCDHKSVDADGYSAKCSFCKKDL